MDAVELSNVVKGLLISKGDKLSSIRSLELQSCWGAFGSYPSGQIMANEFNAPVKAYRWKYSAANANSFMNAVDFEPVKDAKTHIRMMREHARKNEFWNRLLSIYDTSKRTRHKRFADAASEDYPVFRDIALLVTKQQSIDDFLNMYPWFWGKHDPDNQQPLLFKTLMTQVLSKIINDDSSEMYEPSITVNFASKKLQNGFPNSIRNTAISGNETSNIPRTTFHSTAHSTTGHISTNVLPGSRNEKDQFMQKCESILILNNYIFDKINTAIREG